MQSDLSKANLRSIASSTSTRSGMSTTSGASGSRLQLMSELELIARVEENEMSPEDQASEEIIEDKKFQWQAILLLPYEPVWCYTLMFMGASDVILTLLYYTIPDDEVLLGFAVYDLICDILYGVDGILCAIGKNSYPENIPLLAVVNPNWVILTQIISAFPCDYFASQKEDGFLKTICGTFDADLLKCVKVYYFVYFNSGEVGINLGFVEAGNAALKVLFMIPLCFGLSAKSFCYGVDKCKPKELLMERFSYVITKFTLNSYGDRPPLSLMTYLISTFILMLSFFVMITTICSLTIIYTNRRYNFHEFVIKKEYVRYMCEVKYKYHTKAMDKCLKMLDMNWRTQRASKLNADFPKILPPATQQELAVDIYWVALKHSKLFQNMDLPFLRKIAMYMKQEFYRPGDFLFTKDVSKNKMVYVVSGVVQILSEVDGETPILAFSNGTVFGESSLIISHDATTNARCKNYCEFHVLHKKDFLRIVHYFPKQFQKLRKNLALRYEKSEKLQDVFGVVNNQVYGVTNMEQATIMWLKTTLHKLMMSENESATTHEFRNIFLRDEFRGDKYGDMLFTANYLDMLAIAGRMELVTDSVFLKHTFPCIFQPGCLLVTLWNTFVFLYVIGSGFIIPYLALIAENSVETLSMYIYLCNVVYWFDIAMQLMTAVRLQTELLTTFKAIFMHKVGTFHFWMDICAAFPLEMYYCLFMTSEEGVALLQMNRILKMWKIRTAVKIASEKDTSWHYLMLIYYAKHIFTCFYITYLFGVIMYSRHCYNNICDLSVPGETGFEKYTWYFCAVGNILNLCGIINAYVEFHDDFFIYAFVMGVALLLFMHAVSEISSLFSLNYKLRMKLEEIVLDVSSVLKEANVENSYLEKLIRYVNTQYQYNKAVGFLLGGGIFKDMTESLFFDVREHVFAELLQTLPIFDGLRYEAICDLCVACKLIILPPGETVTVNGNVSDSFFVVVKGFCNVFSDSNVAEKVLKPGAGISMVEACMKLPSVHTVVTASYCELVSFEMKKVWGVLTRYPRCLGILRFTMESSGIERGLRRMAKRYATSVRVPNSVVSRNDPRSFNSFWKMPKGSTREKEHLKPFKLLNKFSWIRYLFMPFTIMPHGKFMVRWEMSRSFFAFISAIVFVINPIVTSKSAGPICSLLFLDLTCLVDMYLRMHVCYYNEKGVLVTHPLYTAQYYITHSFLTDLVCVFPIKILMKYEDPTSYKLITFMHANHVLQLYRYVGLVKVCVHRKTPLNRTLYVLKYLPPLIVLSNFIASMVSNSDCDFHEDVEASAMYQAGVVCEPDSFISVSEFKKPMSAMYVHLISFYYVTSVMTLTGMQGFKLVSQKDCVYTVFTGFLGLFILWSVIADLLAIFNSKNSSLLHYQIYLKDMKNFMSKRKLRQNVRADVIRHYELKWQRRKGRNLHKTLERFTQIIAQDILWKVYGAVLEKYSIFPVGSKSFYRWMLLNAHHDIIENGNSLALVSSINKYMYFIFKGYVDVIAPDGTKLTTLSVGGVCGNLDNAERSRQTVQLVANGHCEILRIESIKFHDTLRNFSELKSQFQVLTAMHIDYLPGNSTVERKFGGESGKLRYHENKWLNKILEQHHHVYNPSSIGMVIWKVSFVSIICYTQYMLICYGMVINDQSNGGRILAYVCDFLFVVDLCLRFRTAYEDDAGILVKDLAKIKRKLLKEDRLYLIVALITIIPFEIICYIFSMKSNYRACMRVNKLLRIIFFYQYFRDLKRKLNVNLYYISTFYLFCVTLLLIHTCTCASIFVSCMHTPNKMPPTACKVFADENAGFLAHLESYTESMYMITCCLTHNSQTRFYPVSVCLLLTFSIFMLTCTLTVGIAFAKMHANFQMKKYVQLSYSRLLDQLKHYMDREEVSVTLGAMIWRYVRLLWRRKRGTTFPVLLEELPRGLKENILNQCFAQHVTKHRIFKDCHEDFLRQIVLHFRMMTYFPGDYIVFKGNIDGCMYFIEQGEVIILTEDTSYKETAIGVLRSGSAFGVQSGFGNLVPHTHTFRARGVVEMLILEKSTWDYLLGFFPASNISIHEELESYDGY